MSIFKTLFSVTKNVKLWLATSLMLLASSAFAGNATGGIGGAQIGGLLADIVGVVEGPLGQIIIILSFVWGIFRVLQQDWIQMFGAFLGGLVLINIGSIVDDIFGASTTAIETVSTQILTIAPVLANVTSACVMPCCL
jgi:hypothetical protein